MGASAPTSIRKLMRNNKRILDYDPATGILETFHYDAVEDKAIIETSQDMTAILEANKEHIIRLTKMHDGKEMLFLQPVCQTLFLLAYPGS